MRITLDYYRILSVPIKADSQQLNRAYEDRLKQQARREYSGYAISARKKLLKQAYTVLSDPETRAEYDGSFFAPIKPDSLSSQDSVLESSPTILARKPVAVNPYIEIEPELLVGALMILYELAEYEMVLHLGNDYLDREQSAFNTNSSSVAKSKAATQTVDKTEQEEDILLCLALSYLELSREQWRREEWEQAAASGQMGLDILPPEKPILFNIRAEIESELNLLKPYRILALLAQDNPDLASRSKGLQLLQEMLLQRDGIEGDDDDPSGLKLDQFLCFIQQIRTYLTLQEQKELFLAEAKRGSHPGSCVAAYSLIAEGYAYKKPSSILQAKKIFQELSVSQDTYWERAVCALLLGQTAESQQVIKQSQETNTLELIKKRSQNSPDLLPGLCFYGEQWLQEEVLSQFRDLKSHRMTLSDYFGDRGVQIYLEQISPPARNSVAKTSVAKNSVAKTNDQTFASKSTPISIPKSQPNSTAIPSQKATTSSEEENKIVQRLPWWIKKKISNKIVPPPVSSGNVQSPPKSPTLAEVVASKTRDAAPVADNYRANGSQARKLSENKTISRNSGSKVATILPPQLVKTKNNKNKNNNNKNNKNNNKYAPNKATTSKTKTTKRKRKPKNTSLKSYGRNWLLLLGLICGVGTLGFVFTSNQLQSKSEQKPELESVTKPQNPQPVAVTPKPEPAVESTTPNAEVKPEVSAKPPATPDVFDRESAETAIQKWLDSKAAALGQEHQVEQLNSILTASLLTQWRDRSNYYKQNNIHRQFEHSLKIRSVKVNPDNPNVATVEAEIEEVARHYQRGKLNQAQSYSDNLLVSYQLIRQNDSWLIKNNKVLQSL